MGRDNRDKWTFYVHPSKKTIDAEMARYWKHQLAKILKIGLEYEFNLPDKNGTCKGDNNACPCKHMAEESCWKECVRAAECEAKKKGQCFGLFCTGFLSACVSCAKFEVDCKSCEQRFDPKRNPDHIRDRMSKELQPSQSYGTITAKGVHSITTDGSLLGKKGAEVITVGRRVDFWEFYKMSREIIELAMTNSAYVNERTSIHAHLLATYYGKVPGGNMSSKDGGSGIPAQISELERDMPEIILANFHQLCRRYQNAITWMSMGLDDPKHMTRWEKFRVSVLHISAIMNSMSRVQQEVATNAGGNKYGWVNYNYCDFSENGDLRRLHVEMRAMDCLLSPSAVAAFSCLYYAMMIKAVEISRYGIAEVGDKEWMQRAEAIKNRMLNNVKGYQDGDRFGDTSDLAQHYETLISESFDLISQVKHILMKLGPAYEILEKLAERPCSLRRCDGETWEKIEKDLVVEMSAQDLFTSKLGEIIDLRLIDQCKDETEWIRETSNMLRDNDDLSIDSDDDTVEDKVFNFVERKKNDGEMVFLDRIGAMATI
jgi:hypothetical protein